MRSGRRRRRGPGASRCALHIGGGGFTVPRYLAAVRPGTDNLVLEVDPGVVALGRDQLALRRPPDLRVRVGDARVGSRRSRRRPATWWSATRSGTSRCRGT